MLSPFRHYVYKHFKRDTNEVFYVGKGSFRKRGFPVFERPYDLHHARNPRWKNIVNKHGFYVGIHSMCETDAEAQAIEKKLISEIGRADLGKGPLVNFTDGGDGSCGIIIPESALKKRSEAAKRPRSDAWIEAIRVARKDGGNGGVVKKGDKLPEEWRQNIANGQRGPNNYMRGRKGKDHPNTRRVVDQSTGHLYYSVQEASDFLGYKMKTLYNWLSGHRENPTQLRFA